MAAPNDIVDARMLIGGEWIAGDAILTVRNPADPTEVVGQVPAGSGEHAAEAIAAAKAAQRSWGRLSFQSRAAALKPALAEVEALAPTLAALYARENGRTLQEAAGELGSIAINQLQTLGLAPTLDEATRLSRGAGYTSMTTVPYGVVVSIVPWNAPAALAFLHVVPALLAGNAVVVKPPETCPLTLIALLRAFAQELPSGLVNIVTGDPSSVGPALTTHPDVGKIAFTGGAASAARIAAAAAATVKSLTLELGGNDPAILMPGFQADAATLAALRRGVFMNTGQVCMAIKRLYVHQDDAARFVEAFTSSVDEFVVGDGLRPEVTMGPLHSAAARARSRALVEDARRRGARVRELGSVRRPAEFEAGYFMRPVVVTELSDDAPLMAEEQFCPAIPIATYRHVDEAVQRANDSPFGLSASVWGRDLDRAASVARSLEAGAVFVNGHGVASLDRRLPYGGLKQSGQGRKASTQGVLEYCQTQSLTVLG